MLHARVYGCCFNAFDGLGGEKMYLELNIQMDNAAFDVAPEVELNVILLRVGSDILGGLVFGNCVDANGNSVGQWEIVDD